ncbi:unnamed protein product [Caenorhabditis angaria]|uniref:Adenylate kinase isoenzyme 5 n=1 Tax=Caenorhabditis angaria TaxID=860376 RepID=A0A9P1J3H7_9PELO|nr:unnamed protein product [Caenorhabditis angaria]
MSGPDAKYWLQDHRIPQLFEGLMTGLIYIRPEDPLDFMEAALKKVRAKPDMIMSWDMFINDSTAARVARDYPNRSLLQSTSSSSGKLAKARITTNAIDESIENSIDEGDLTREPSRSNTVEHRSPEPRLPSVESQSQEEMVAQRVASVTRAAEVAKIPDVPVILFMGGPGGGKTRHAARVADSLVDNGLVHICMPDIIRSALAKYKDKYPEWKEANEHYVRGELIPNQLALMLLKAEMGRHPSALGFFLEGYPREARQVEDFERQVKSVNMALILDYDERTLRDHMERRGLGMEIIDQKIKEFKQKTLPSAKYFDDQKLLHLIPGEKDDNTIYEKMKGLVIKALETGVPVLNSTPSSSQATQPQKPRTPSPTPIDSEVKNNAIETNVAHIENIESNQQSSTIRSPKGKPPSPPSPPKTEESVRDEIPPTPSIQTPDESRINTTATTQNEPARLQSPPQLQTQIIVPQLNLPRENGTADSAAVETPSTPVVAASTTVGSSEPINLTNNAPVILVLGAPGSQKNDIGRRIAQKYDGFTLLSMGDILRKKVASEKNDQLWEKVGTKMDNGESIATKVCRSVLFEELESRGNSWGYVIEGYPKTPDQLTDVEMTLQRIDLALLIDCTEQFCLSVIEQRNPDNRRPDDTTEHVKSRMEFFKKNTLPMLKSLDERGKLRVVDGDSDPDTVFKEVTQVIDTVLYIEDDGEGASLGESKKGALESSTNSSSVN